MYVYILQFKNARNYTYVFSSIKAIYEKFTYREIGCGFGNLYNYGVADGLPYSNPYVTITKHPVYSKPQVNKHVNKATGNNPK